MKLTDGPFVLAPEEQNVYSTVSIIHRSVGAECKSMLPKAYCAPLERRIN
jgi:hypothetical protein